jgi:hypothetical protein
MNFRVRYVLIAILAAMVAEGCSSGVCNDEFDFNRLVGRWVYAESESAQFEEWQLIGEDAFSGRGFVLESGDTTFIETLELTKVNCAWTYSAKVLDGASAEVVPFTLTKQSQRVLEFVNPSHDFPKKIVYELLSPDEMQVYIEGPRDGQNIRIMFHFARSE